MAEHVLVRPDRHRAEVTVTRMLDMVLRDSRSAVRELRYTRGAVSWPADHCPAAEAVVQVDDRLLAGALGELPGREGGDRQGSRIRQAVRRTAFWDDRRGRVEPITKTHGLKV